MKNPSSKSNADRETIFHALLESDLPESEKRNERLINEVIVLIGAGSHTVAWALTVATYHILSAPSILRNMKEELSAAKRSKKGEPLTLPDLEKLPYLTAVTKEGLRLSYGKRYFAWNLYHFTKTCFSTNYERMKGKAGCS